jgi:hypothetical protein
VTDTCSINWHIASSHKESFTVCLAFSLSPIIECDVNNAEDVTHYVTYKSNKFSKSHASLFVIKRQTYIYKLLDTILELVLWKAHVHYEGFNRISFL